MSIFFILQLWLLVILQPLELQGCTVSHYAGGAEAGCLGGSGQANLSNANPEQHCWSNSITLASWKDSQIKRLEWQAEGPAKIFPFPYPRSWTKVHLVLLAVFNLYVLHFMKYRWVMVSVMTGQMIRNVTMMVEIAVVPIPIQCIVLLVNALVKEKQLLDVLIQVSVWLGYWISSLGIQN